ncbi:MAG: VOC family protein [Alphaproteobacteria bacterium]|nr:VOC family protein [Alphaproteobacteria bacterium]
MKFGYTIIYVAQVVETIEFYEKAFGMTRKFIHESHTYAELDTGETILAFAAHEAAELNDLSITPNRRDGIAAGFEVCLVTDNVQEAYGHAVENGASGVSKPAQKPWGQTVAYLRDLNGCLVEICTEIAN